MDGILELIIVDSGDYGRWRMNITKDRNECGDSIIIIMVDSIDININIII